MVNKMQNYSISRKFAINIGVILLAISMILPVHVQAADTSMKFTPSADAFVLATSPDNNFGSNISLRVDNSPDTRSYLRFEITGLNASQIVSAKLRVYANSANTTGYSVQVVDDTSWTESGITFQNAPPIGDEIVKSSSFKKAVWTEVDITPFITGDGTYNLALTTQNVTNTNLASREAGVTKAPQLVVSFGTVEPPVPTDPPAPTDIPTQQPTNLPTVVPTQLPTSTAAPTLVPPTSVPTQGVSPTATKTSTPYTDWQPTFPIRAAFYYPWFPEAWTQQGITPYTNYTPSMGYYSESDQATVKTHIDMMTYGNIQAGIASWWGQGSRSDTRIAGLLSAASGTNFRWSVYYENESLGDPSIAQIQNDLAYIYQHYGKDPSYLRVNDKFVVFVYADAVDACGMADRWKTGNTSGAYVVLKVFGGYSSCANQPDSWHQYSPAVATDQQGTTSYAISPGFWLKAQNVRLARDFTRWTQNVKSMVASNAKWQLVTTFNEWGEGTIVEPAAEWTSNSGYGQYLDALHFNGNMPGGSPTATGVVTSTKAPTAIPTTGPTTVPNSTATPTRTPTGTVLPTNVPTADPTAMPSSTATPSSVGTTNTLLIGSDICKHNVGSTDYTGNCKKTGDLVRSLIVANPGAQVQTLGDNVNNDGGSSAYDAQYKDLFAPNWGSFLNVTHSVMGNHDTYAPSGTAPYFNYFGAAAGPNPGGYYSYDIGQNWHIIALNAQCSQAGGCGATSPQTTWLQADLAANTKKCVIAVWHQPRWTSGRHSDDSTSAAWWNLLYQYKVDIVANGHNHNYERFNLIDPSEQAAADGIREFVVGTGGAPSDGYSYTDHPLDPNEAIRNQTGVFGILKLTLGDNYYTWNFVPVPGSTFTDSGTTLCH
jgi:hypothetical protein